MSRRRNKFASEELKLSAASALGIGEQVRREGWRGVTTEQVGLVVREMVRRGEAALLKKTQNPLE